MIRRKIMVIRIIIMREIGLRGGMVIISIQIILINMVTETVVANKDTIIDRQVHTILIMFIMIALMIKNQNIDKQ